jgi:predicted esterase
MQDHPIDQAPRGRCSAGKRDHGLGLLVVVAAVACGSGAIADQPLSSADIKAARLKAFDRNSDGKIEQGEVEKGAWVRLSLFDKNGDGALTGTELNKLEGPRNPNASRMGKAPPTFAMHTFQSSSGASIDYGLFTPQSIAAGAKLPLVLCLHGSGGEPSTAKAVSSDPRQASHPCFVMAPLCDSSKSRWVDQGFADPLERRSVGDEVMGALDDVIATHPIDPNRVYIAGLSMGGTGTWGLSIAHRDRFAAAAVMCGNADPDDAVAIAKLPIWVFHGDADPTVPVEASRRMVKALKDAGGEPRYTEFPGVGHNCWDKAHATDELWDWMFAQRRIQAAAPPDGTK